MTGRHPATTVTAALAALFAAASLVQVFLAGIGVFEGDYSAHRGFGFALHGLAILVFVAALVSPERRRLAPLGLGLALLVTVQISLVDARGDAPALAALHPLIGVLDIGFAAYIAWRARTAPGTPARPARA